MEIIEQLSDRKFVVELEDCDFDNSRILNVAHDYVRFWSNEGLQAKSGVQLHTVNTCANWIPMRQCVTIPIRQLIQVVLPILSKREECSVEHLKGNKYAYEEDSIIYWDGKEKMIALRRQGETKYTHLPYSMYEYIQNFKK